MFIDDEWKKNTIKEENDSIGYEPESKKIKPLYLIVGAVFFIALATGTFYYYINSDFIYTETNPPVVKKGENKATSTPSLPDYFNKNNGDLDEGQIPDDLQAEDLHFGSFYKKPDEKIESAVKKFDLPLNIKSDVINYYDVSRKIDIENSVEDLNENAFAFLDSRFNSEESDFFEMYRELIEKEIPLLISSDFIRYYNQNTQKQVYKEIEKSVFYENLWDICKKLYDISLARYQNHIEEEGLVNNPLLEGERLETSFLAVALELLKPKAKQISSEDNFSEENLFNEQESQSYYFNMPRDIEREVMEEVALIYDARKTAQSPIFLYEKNYKDFSVPVEYSNDAKLNNYYQAKKWMNSLFPLFFHSEECPDCSLDYNDWLNNFAAANLIAQDFSENQDLKNRWAAIYKFIAFFEGLRSDLTYLHLDEVGKEVFGDSDKMREFFEKSTEQGENIKKIQAGLEGVQFLSIEGGVSRRDKDERPYVGMRLLQDNFWPNEYIFSELTGTDMTKESDQQIRDVITACSSYDSSLYFRCLGFSGDILRIHKIVPSQNYYSTNLDYENYDNALDNVLSQIDLFDYGTLNSNVYWINFDLSKTVVDNSKEFISRLSLNDRWIKTKTTNEILGTWANSALAKDDWENYKKEQSRSLGFAPECSLYSYVEPQVELYADMIARNKMLLSAIEVLRVEKKTNAATLLLRDLNKKLIMYKEISEKELEGNAINEEECYELKEMVSDTAVLKAGDKKLLMKNQYGEIEINIEGVRLLAMIKGQGDDRALVVGPVFNFKEKSLGRR